MNNAINLLDKYCKDIEINLAIENLQKFKIYLEFLLEYNKHTNLTSITEPTLIAIKHFLDCLLVSKAVKISPNDTVIDIGTGAGFPGIPLKIQTPEIQVTLVDSREKRINFLKELSDKLGIHPEILSTRAEDLGKRDEYRQKFNIAVSRAVASLNILCEYCLPFVNVGGHFIALKGPNPEDEITNAKNAITKLGGEIEKVEKFELPEGNGKRSILVIKKVTSTSLEYPRAGTRIAKKPL